MRLVYASLCSLDGYVNDVRGEWEFAFPDEEVHAADIAQALPGQLVAAQGDHEHVLALGEAREHRDGRPGARGITLENAGHDVDAAVARPVGQGTAQSGGRVSKATLAPPFTATSTAAATNAPPERTTESGDSAMETGRPATS